jgi:hypothetical protein
MSPRSRQAARAVAAFLIIALFQVYVLADATRPIVASSTTLSAVPANMIFGKLSLHGSRLILVNGNSVGSGTTIFSGAQLQTPEDTEATVLLGTVGHLDIAPNSNLTVTFDEASVDVMVMAGHAVLSTNAGVTGTVRNADGKVERSSNPANATSVVGLAPIGSTTRATAAAATKEEKLSLIIIPLLIAAVIVAVAVNNGGNNDNVSASTPTNL